MKTHEILATIRDRVSPAAHEWLNGVSGDVENDLIIEAQRNGLDAAVAAIEELASTAGEENR